MSAEITPERIAELRFDMERAEDAGMLYAICDDAIDALESSRAEVQRLREEVARLQSGAAVSRLVPAPPQPSADVVVVPRDPRGFDAKWGDALSALRSSTNAQDAGEMSEQCQSCNGNGWTAEHDPCDPHEDGICDSCPIQVQCEDCNGTGYAPAPQTDRGEG